MRLMDENYQDFLEKWYMGQLTGYTGNPLSQEEARKKALEEIPEPYYNPKHNTTKRMCYNKLGQYEDIDESPKHLAKVNKALEIISKAYGDYANHRISEYELIMIVGENTAL